MTDEADFSMELSPVFGKRFKRPRPEMSQDVHKVGRFYGVVPPMNDSVVHRRGI